MRIASLSNSTFSSGIKTINDSPENKAYKIFLWANLSDLYNFPEQTMAIGRLDEKSEGLLLLTTDGKFSEYIRSAKVEKEYHVMVDGIITPKHIESLKKW